MAHPAARTHVQSGLRDRRLTSRRPMQAISCASASTTRVSPSIQVAVRPSRAVAAPAFSASHSKTAAIAALGDGLRSQLSDPAPLPAHNPASAFLPKIYGREQEKARLQRMSGTEPTHIALFTGPPNSGKTALLKDYCEERQYQGVCYMDCLQTDCTTSKGLAEGLAKHGLPTLVRGLPPQYAKQALGVLTSGQDAVLRVSYGEPPLTVTDDRQLQNVIKSSLYPYLKYEKVLEAIEGILQIWQEARVNGALPAHAAYPTIIIDKADSLKSLCTTHEKDIMGFLVRLSKQERLAHVWLATSCWSFSAWVEKELDRSYWQPVTISHLQEDEAKGLLRHLLGWPSLEDDSNPAFLLPPPPDSSSALASAQQGAVILPGAAGRLPSEEEQAAIIDQVYKVVGGNPGQLRTVGLALRSGETVEEALKPHVAMALAAVQATMLGGRGFTGQQFATLAALILKSGGACRREDAELQLGILASRPPTDPSDFNLDRDIEQRKKGREVLEAMLSANVVRLQPPSSVFPGSSQMARQQLPSNDLRASLLSTQSLSPQPSLYLGYGRAAAEGQGAGTQGFRVAAPSAFELQLWRQQLKQSETRIRASKTEFVMLWQQPLPDHSSEQLP